MAKKLTETEAMAVCLVASMVPAEKFGKDEAEKAVNKATSILTAGEIEASDFARVVARLGNHSAMRQWGVKMGFVKANDSEPDALCNEMRRLIKAGDEKTANAAS